MDKDKGKTVYTKDVILVMAASFFFMFSVMFVTPLINGYAISLGASSSFAGFVVGIMSVASLFLRPIAGNITDIFSKYRLSLIGGILIAIGIIGYVITPNSELLLLFRLINGTCAMYSMYDYLAWCTCSAKSCWASNGLLWLNECVRYGNRTSNCD